MRRSKLPCATDVVDAVFAVAVLAALAIAGWLAVEAFVGVL